MVTVAGREASVDGVSPKRLAIAVARRTAYRIDPVDGLVARVVGPWVARKTHFVDRYVAIFTNAMKAKWKRRVYVELFAGPGRSFNDETHEFLDGSAVRALAANFTDYVFVDVDKRATTALQKRIDRIDHGKTVHVIHKDCNRAVHDILAHIPRGGLTLMFVDPTNWQVTFDTVSALAIGRRMDLIVTFHYGNMRRVRDQSPAALTRFFATPKWRDGDDAPYWYRLYNQQLEGLGYLSDCYTESETITNRKNVRMYGLVLFTKDRLGRKFWNEARAIDENRQLPMGFLRDVIT
jgi:three-Cys-motif partner protein